MKLPRVQVVKRRSRSVELEACFNFRDLGGLKTKDGRRVRRGLLYRADSLSWLTYSDAVVLQRLGLRTVIDLRSSAEFARDGHSVYLTGAEIQNRPLFDSGDATFASLGYVDRDPPAGQLYVEIVESCGEAISDAFQAIAESEMPTVFHCAAGKDRTGVLACLVLGALGVTNEEIIEDYSMSSLAVERKIAWAKTNSPALAAGIESLPVWLRFSSPEHMTALLGYFEREHQSIDRYLEKIGISAEAIARLRDQLIA